MEELLSKMSLKQKISQLTQIVYTGKNFEEVKCIIEKNNIGSIILASSATSGNSDVTVNLERLDELQTIAMEQHGVPLLFGHDVIHGHHICLPIPLGLAASFNMPLIREGYECVAKEAKNDGINWTFTPMLDISRDPRWGRVVEGAGEDPYLGGEIAKAIVEAFQGKEEHIYIAACAKHFIGYGASEGGRDYHKAEISNYTLHNDYLCAFKEAINSGCATMMSSFNEVSGQPVTSSRYLLTDVLRGELGFQGFVVSDYNAIEQLIRQGVAEDKKEAACLALQAGVDMDMADRCYYDYLEEAVAEGTVSEEIINESVRRILSVKKRMGLWEKPYVQHQDIDLEKHRTAARKLAAESIVLLKNKDNLLPLKPTQRVSVLGEMAKDKRAILSCWVLDFDINESVCILDGLKAACNNVEYYDYHLGHDRSLKKSDAVVVVIGESHRAVGEANSKATIEISDADKELIHMARRMNKHVIGVLCYARPIAMECVEELFDAVLYVWHGGSQTGNAVADILFGKQSPSGRLPMTIPRVTGQIPIYYNFPPSGRNADGYYTDDTVFENYWDCSGKPMYPFGYGLSYATFVYSDIRTDIKKLSLEAVLNGQYFQVSVWVKNISQMDSKEVIQCYIRDCKSTMTRPIKELKGFEKVMLCAGEEKCVIFRIGYEQLGYYDGNSKFVIEKGDFLIYVGHDCMVEQYVQIKVS